jgi:hypothetical protein
MKSDENMIKMEKKILIENDEDRFKNGLMIYVGK